MSSTIGGVGGAGAGWQDVTSSNRGTARQDRMFAKVDRNGDRSVDGAELQGMLDRMAQKSGGTALDADDALKTMDTDGNGTLDASELDAGMKSLMPEPSSTVGFAQQRGGEGVHGGDTPPSPPDGADAAGSTDAAGASNSADGLQSLLADLFQAADTDGNGTLNRTELDTLKTNFDTALQSLESGTGSVASIDGGSSGTAGTSGSGDGTDAATAGNASDPILSTLTALANLVLKEYAASAATGGGSAQTAGIDVTA